MGNGRAELPETADVVIVGAGFSGMYLLKLLRAPEKGARVERLSA